MIRNIYYNFIGNVQTARSKRIYEILLGTLFNRCGTESCRAGASERLSYGNFRNEVEFLVQAAVACISSAGLTPAKIRKRCSVCLTSWLL